MWNCRFVNEVWRFTIRINHVNKVTSKERRVCIS